MAYTGFLYVGLMIDSTGQARVVEYNVRLGDPETQPLMMRLKSDLATLLSAAVDGTLAGCDTAWHDGSAIGVVLSAGNYPEGGSTGEPIHGIDAAESAGCKVFHAGTRLHDERLETAGGRVLCVCAMDKTLAGAKQRADTGATTITWKDYRWRRDIGSRGISQVCCP